MAEQKSILIIVTNQDHINEEIETGLWLEEFAVPYEHFKQASYNITVASPKGGDAPIDPHSMTSWEMGEFKDDIPALKDTKPLALVDPSDFDAVFFPGGHGTMFDFSNNPDIGRIVSQFFQAGKPVATICHGAAALLSAKLSDGTPLVKGHKVTSFTNEEEIEVKCDQLMPFLLESKLGEYGADFEPAPNWSDHVVTDGNLITGQNPQSSGTLADIIINTLSQ
jgi:putative intracellular protease/amidase